MLRHAFRYSFLDQRQRRSGLPDLLRPAALHRPATWPDAPRALLISSWIGYFEDMDEGGFPLSALNYGLLLSTPLKNFKEKECVRKDQIAGRRNL